MELTIMKKNSKNNSVKVRYPFRTGPVFRDMLYLLSLSFAVLLIYALIQIQPPAKKSEIERKAEVLIILEWDERSAADMDLWVMDPQNNIVWFRQKTGGFLHLDKDDLGQRNDTIMIDGDVKIIYLNREVVTIRGIVPGEYITNVHAYRTSKEASVNGYVRLLKLNPYVEYATEHFTLENKGDEITVFRFYVDKDGYISDINQDQHKFIKNRDDGPNESPQ
jgi:hypothetical protein